MSDWAIVTGASRGIGREAAARFLKEGWRVLSLSRQDCPVPGVLPVRVDLGEPGWEPLVERTLRETLGAAPGRVCLIHNAALYAHDDALSLSAEHLRRVLEVNIVAPAQLNRLVRGYLSPGSSILYVGSTLSEKAVRGAASYVTSKHAIAGLMRATCQDLTGTQVHTVCVCPGFTDTEMLREHLGDTPEVRTGVAARTTFGRLITPGEIAGVLFQCALTPVLHGSLVHANLGQIET
ncbi:SDR family NAD(P)-dependent oxidoreductase [Stigmatella erecta]|uniref:NAD(P)-dependent dehydrogenase, short-chain alcohol dehydrogenase family n=1 Tax=Stigmatella erecta TaxID=83460 RepID=A0A1I0H5R5_9BACT|nr:SDR family oxidoreductase [Stigmatella erecta]SET78966.1 NAD(P)-dependent dehydrogenase, short-chain alcohol dehydrogenase family [Stigmatella erecta]